MDDNHDWVMELNWNSVLLYCGHLVGLLYFHDNTVFISVHHGTTIKQTTTGEIRGDQLNDIDSNWKIPIEHLISHFHLISTQLTPCTESWTSTCRMVHVTNGS